MLNDFHARVQSTVCKEIVRLLGERSVDISKVCVLHEESFYKELNPEEQQLAEEGIYNFDHPGELHKF